MRRVPIQTLHTVCGHPPRSARFFPGGCLSNETLRVMTHTRTWGVGDRVVHSGRPEWGAGAISAAIKTTHNGHPCQSLTIRFERAGIKTINTAYASLIPADQAPSLPPSGPDPIFSPTDAPGARGERSGSKFRIHDDASTLAIQDKLSGMADVREQMIKLPDAATDPFSSPLARLKATLATFKFSPQGGSLLDWAAIQSGLADPMSRFNRHELEKFFEAFSIVREQHLRRLLPEVRKADPSGAQQVIAAAPSGVQQALRRIDAQR